MKSLLASSVSKTRKVTPMQLMEEIQNIVASEKKKIKRSERFQICLIKARIQFGSKNHLKISKKNKFTKF